MGYSNEIKEKAFGLYCQGKNPEEISKALNVKRAKTIEDWRAKFNWKKRRGEIEANAGEKADNWRAKEIAKAVKKHYEVARGIREIVAQRLNQIIKSVKKRGKPSSLELERLSKTLKNTTDVERQALGLATNQIEVSADVRGAILGYVDADLDEDTKRKLDAILEDIIVAGQASDGKDVT